jgi:hypothetical protein
LQVCPEHFNPASWLRENVGTGLKTRSAEGWSLNRVAKLALQSVLSFAKQALQLLGAELNGIGVKLKGYFD